MEDRPQSASPGVSRTLPSAPSLAGEDRGAGDVAGRDLHDVEEPVNEVDVVDHARAVGTGEALDLGRRERPAERPRDLLGAPAPALLDQPCRHVVAGEIVAVRDEGPGIGIVDLDRDQAETLALAVDQLGEQPPGRVEALHVADLDDAAGAVARGGDAGRRPRPRSRAASREKTCRPRSSAATARSAW